jgi:hypothetical protein
VLVLSLPELVLETANFIAAAIDPSHKDVMAPKGTNTKKVSGRAKKEENETKKRADAKEAEVSHPPRNGQPISFTTPGVGK